MRHEDERQRGDRCAREVRGYAFAHRLAVWVAVQAGVLAVFGILIEARLRVALACVGLTALALGVAAVMSWLEGQAREEARQLRDKSPLHSRRCP